MIHDNIAQTKQTQERNADPRIYGKSLNGNRECFFNFPLEIIN
jgi:hypothetical protein